MPAASFCERLTLLTERAHSLLRARCSASAAHSAAAGWRVISSAGGHGRAEAAQRSLSSLRAAPLQLLPTHFVNDREGARSFERAVVHGGVCCDSDGRVMVAVGECGGGSTTPSDRDERPQRLCVGQTVTVRNPAAALAEFGTRSKYPVAQMEIRYPTMDPACLLL